MIAAPVGGSHALGCAARNPETSMKLYRLPRPASLEALAMTEEATPSPGPGQALVRVRATCLNYRDLMVATGLYGGTGREPGAALGRRRGGRGDRAGGHAGEAGDRRPDIHAEMDGRRLTPSTRPVALGGAIDGMLAE